MIRWPISHPLIIFVISSPLLLSCVYSTNALVLSWFERYSRILMTAWGTLDQDFVAICFQMLLNFSSELDLLTLRARNAFFWALLVEMLLQLNCCKLHGFWASIWTAHQSCLTTSFKMRLKLIVLKAFTTALSLIWALEFKLVQHLSIKLMHFTRGLCEILTTSIFIANQICGLSAFVASDVFTIMAFHWFYHDVAAFWTD